MPELILILLHSPSSSALPLPLTQALMKEGLGEEHLSLAWQYTDANDEDTIVQSRVVIPALYSRVTMPADADTSVSTRAPTNAPTPTSAPTTPVPTPTSAPTNSPTPTAAPSQIPTTAPSFPIMGATLDTWTGIEGNSIANLMAGTNNLSNTPNQSNLLSSLLEVPLNSINANDLGVRMSGWLVPPTTGGYKFWIASDDEGELWLSSNGNPANKERVCHVSPGVPFRQFDQYPQQYSAVIPLVAGQAYYYEVSCCCRHQLRRHDDVLTEMR